jgi:hypothetical protein
VGVLFGLQDLGTTDSSNIEFKVPQINGLNSVGETERTLMTVESGMQVHENEA